MPSDLINNNYRYTVNNYYYTVRTNQNCYTNYNTQYCDCYDVYFNNDYLRTNAYSCNYNTSTNISVNNFTSSYWYKNNIDRSLIIFILFAIIIIVIPYKILTRLFGWWIKC